MRNLYSLFFFTLNNVEWIPPTIELLHQGFVLEGSSIQIKCVGNTLQRRNIVLVNSLDVVVQPRVVVNSVNSFSVIFGNIRRNATDIYQCRETINGQRKYSNQISVNVSCKKNILLLYSCLLCRSNTNKYVSFPRCLMVFLAFRDWSNGSIYRTKRNSSIWYKSIVKM